MWCSSVDGDILCMTTLQQQYIMLAAQHHQWQNERVGQRVVRYIVDAVLRSAYDCEWILVHAHGGRCPVA